MIKGNTMKEKRTFDINKFVSEFKPSHYQTKFNNPAEKSVEEEINEIASARRRQAKIDRFFSMWCP